MIRKLLRSAGLDLVRFSPAYHPVARLGTLLRTCEIELVVDVGANTGQFARLVRECGYRGPMLCIEPTSAAFAELAEFAARDGRITALQLALGDVEERARINIAGNSQSSSLLPMLPAHLLAAPASTYVGSEEVEVRRLDALLPGHANIGQRVFLKIDTQGYEQRVIAGAGAVLQQIRMVQMELSFVPMYAGEVPFDAAYAEMRTRGFEIAGIAPAFSDPQARLLQVDVVFTRNATRPVPAD